MKTDKLKTLILTPIFMSWFLLPFYMSTGIKNYPRFLGIWRWRFNKDLELFIICITYLSILLYVAPKIESSLSSYIPRNQQMFFHSVALSLLILIVSIWFPKQFELVLKLGIIWCIAVLQWFFRNKWNI